MSGESNKASGRRGQPVKPITDEKDVRRIRKSLRHRPRDLLLFDVCTRTGISLKSVLSLRVSDLMDLQIGDMILTNEANGKSKPDSAVMTETLQQSFLNYLDIVGPDPEAYLFKSRKGEKPLNVSSVSNMVNGWFEKVGLEGLSGVSSLKKTWQLHYSDSTPGISGAWPHLETPGQQGPGRSEPRTLWKGIYRNLLASIISGRIRPGEKLNIESIAEQMAVSLMPVRQAVQRLESIGFVSTQKKTGTIINKLSIEDFSEMFEIRMSLESLATRKACRNMGQPELEELENLHGFYGKARQKSEVKEFIKLNRRFHFLLYRQANMPMMLKIISDLWDKVSPYLHLLLRDVEDYHRDMSLKCHQGILDGLKKGDPEMAVKWIKADLTQGAEMLTKAWRHTSISKYLE